MKPTVHISSTRTVARPCPICRTVLDGVTCLSLRKSEGPREMQYGDVTKCGYCGTFLKLLEFGFVLADPEDLERISKILQKVVHQIPTMPEIMYGKKKPS